MFEYEEIFSRPARPPLPRKGDQSEAVSGFVVHLISGGSNDPDIEVLGPKYYSHNALGTLHHHIWVPHGLVACDGHAKL